MKRSISEFSIEIPPKPKDKCVVGEGCLSGFGYLMKKVNGKTVYLHKEVYESHYKENVPDGWVVDHLCFNKVCLNPKHLQAVPSYVNAARSAKRLKGKPATESSIRNGQLIKERWRKSTCCPRGHLWKDNAYIEPNGKRRCKICKRARLRKWRKGGTIEEHLDES